MFINLEKMRSKQLLITSVNWNRQWNSESSGQSALWAAATIPTDHHAATELVGKNGAGLRRHETGDGGSLS